MAAAVSSPPSSSQFSDLLEPSLARVSERAETFAREPIAKKIAWLYQMRECAGRLAEQWVQLSCQHKRISATEAISGEGWFNGPVPVLRTLRLLSIALSEIEKTGRPQLPGTPKELDNGQLSVPVFPRGVYDRAMLPGVSAEVRMQPGLSVDTFKQASFYSQASPEGRVAGVLGAGNLTSIPLLDSLYKLFVEGQAVVLKLNPVNDYIYPIAEQIFRPLIEQGYMAILRGGASLGGKLCSDPRVDTVHITGSDRTHDAIVWGSDAAERISRRNNNEPLLSKPISSELGNITPVCVVPGPYTAKQFSAMAESIAGMLTQNASFNCVAAKMLVLPKDWDGNSRLLEELTAVLKQVAPRYANYPGARERHQALTLKADAVTPIGNAQEGQLPWTLIAGLDANDPNTLQFRMEPFCSILSVVELSENDPAQFLSDACDFCNDKLWGTLGAMLFVHPSQLNDDAFSTEVEAAVRKLRYGCVAINQWTGVAYAMGSAPWGGHPSSTLTDIQSGQGWVHNTLMLEGIEKCVVRGPLGGPLRPPWSPLHRKAHILGRRLAELETQPSAWRLSKLGLGAVGT